MEMIIGGAYQGKAAYAKAQFPDVDWKFGGEITEEELCLLYTSPSPRDA